MSEINWNEYDETRKAQREAEVEAEYDAFMDEIIEAVKTETPAPAPRRTFTESRQRFVSRKQEDYSYKLAMEIRNILFNQFKEDTSATQWHKNFSIETKLEILEELRAGRNFNVK